MKNITLTALTVLTIVGMSACGSKELGSPSQNSALNSVTTSGKNTKSAGMQKSLDSWLEKEWTPTVEKDKEIQKKYKDEDRDFTLQEYVDKSEAYLKDKNSTKYNAENSHSQKMKSMPVIGN